MTSTPGPKATAATPGNRYPLAVPVGYPATAVTTPASAQAKLSRGASATAEDPPSSPLQSPAAGRVPAERRRTRGPGHRGLMELSALLGERDAEIMTLLARHRFLTTLQVQDFAFHDHASSLTAARICRRVLRRLEGWRLVERPLRPIGGRTAGSAASIWMVSATGMRMLSLRDGLGAIGRVREPGERFVRHYLAIADVHLALVKAARAGRFELLDAAIEPDSWRQYQALDGTSDILKPDLFAVVAGPTFESHWFIEVDRATESVPTVIRQCRLYETYRRTGIEQDAVGLFPHVLWLTPDQRRADKLRSAIRSAQHLARDAYSVATMGQAVDVIAAETLDQDDTAGPGVSR